MYRLKLILVLCANYVVCEKLYYFAYGSNLFRNRMHINLPNAEFYSIAYLPNYKLDFKTIIPMWNGAVATIVEEDGETLWGAVWLIDYDDLKHLDKQEGLDSNLYSAVNVSVTLPNGEEIKARTYIQTDKPKKLDPGSIVPYERRPSITYLKVIIVGATEIGLPEEYLAQLRKIPHNNQLADMEIRKKLGERFMNGDLSDLQ